MHTRSAILIFLFLSLKTYAFGDVILYPFKASNTHVYTRPYSGYFEALNGDFHDASKYYKSESIELNVSGFLLFPWSYSTTLKLPWFLDLGYKSKLYSVDPVIKVGVHVVNINGNRKIELGVDNLIKIGGEVIEWPCVDDLFREFHCGTGLPWVDKPAASPIKQTAVSVRWTMAF